MRLNLPFIAALALCLSGCARYHATPEVSGADAPRVKVLFMGDAGPHKPAQRARQLIPYLLNRGIETTYTDDPDDLNTDNLSRYDAVILYANVERITTGQEEALLGYVERGGGFVPIHCASFCFQNSAPFIDLVGAQFKSHGAGTFRTRFTQPGHPILDGFHPFESWDETYVHHRHNQQGRTVLEYREDEPYTWVRSHGLGRVFYTAWGHNERTWGHPGFLDLIERGVRWAAGQDIESVVASRPVLAPVRYDEQPIPYYPPGAKWGTNDQSWRWMPRPLSPEESMRHMVTPAGFRVELFAAEPQIGKPLCMAWDERGRLWIAETRDYPNERAGEGGRDRIVICEDANGDGRADKFRVFAEGLSIPTSIAFSRGGVVVHQAPHTLFLKDTDGDDRADTRETLFTGWGTKDTHAGPSNIQYGLDNWFWNTVGYSGFEGRVGGRPLKFSMGFCRFRPDGSELEFIRRTNNNTWGLGLSEEGLVFGSTANNNPSVYMPIPDRYYNRVNGWEPGVLGATADSPRFLPITDKVRQVDVHGGYTSGAGHALYTARTYPREYWNRAAFVCEPTGHLIGKFVLAPRGAGFRSHNPSNLVSSDDEWTAPVMAEVGPDGNVWFIDWYNYIVQHNPTPTGHETGSGAAYETPLRDKARGRIYRVVYTRAHLDKPMSLKGASPRRLVAALAHENLFWRRHAQRLLVERGERDVVPALLRLVNDPGVDEIGLNVGAIHALWALHGLGEIDGSDPLALAAAVGALKHPSAGVRRNAALVLPATEGSGRAIVSAGLLEDPDAQVRLASMLALADLRASPEIGKAIYQALRAKHNLGDGWIIDAAASAGATHGEGFLAAANEHSGHAHAHRTDGPNLLPNPSFEEVSESRPLGWSVRTYAGQPRSTPAETARTGARSLWISSESAADSSWFATAKVKPHTRYRLSGWIKTDQLQTRGNARGALLNAHELQLATGAATTGLKSTNDWTLVETIFDSAGRTTLDIDCHFGSWGTATGSAWFDDVSLVELGPSHRDDPERAVAIVRRHQAGPHAPAESEATAPSDGVSVLKLGTVPNLMRYDQPEIKVKSGQRVRLVFTNNDVMQHNWLLLNQGATEKVGALADAMATDPEGLSKAYVPDSPDVLACTRLVDPGTRSVVEFTAPATPGRYPYICTFPGHWRIMRGELVVESNP